MDYLVILNIAAFVLALWQTYKAHASTREANALLEKFNEMQINHSRRFKEQQVLLDKANNQVIEQGAKQTTLLAAATSQTQQIEDQLSQIKEIRQSLSTKFIGRFNEYFPAVADLIETAQNEIVIFCDFPGLGIFSLPNDFVKYRQAIERKCVENKNFRVEITILNEERRLRTMDMEFKKEGVEWDNWKTLKKDLLDQFFYRYDKNLNLESLSRTDFINILESLDKELLENAFSRAECVEIDSEPAIYFWLVDGKTAILAVTPYVEDATSYGFSTTDLKLIAALREISTRYHPKTF